ncbi:4-(cytidine 5'-diphospho)-2-C-methyl-D-erythritol kinase [Opitutales bacterium]|jgi:4-diphosphocytidyl-2-C-methyl-D-erythritol kinase|nr:4-(cytidine 5'-diphospho)-2-C-methyl-D-erythritol kinase [Opitutales bacterium]
MSVKESIDQISLSAPAKINLFLAITGYRSDGFHEINSVLAKIDLCDQVSVEKTDERDEIQCICNGDRSLSGKNNLAWQAVEQWREVTGDRAGVKITIHKNIPSMAGLGGGSSDAVTTLQALNLLNDQPLDLTGLIEVAAKLGSDCPSFLIDGLCHARGRGEKVSSIIGKKNDELNGQRIFLFQPPIGFSTPQLYRSLAVEKAYDDPTWANNQIDQWNQDQLSMNKFCFNGFESIILNKFLFLAPLFEELKSRFDLSFLVSGSGSCCFSFVPNSLNSDTVQDLITDLLGEGTLFWDARISI